MVEKVKRDYWKQGYNKAKEKYKYTDEDMRKAMRLAREGLNDFTWDSFDNIIQSLSQPKMPTHFDFEINNPMFALTIEPKTTINSQGQTVWVGNYIQEP